MAEIIAECWPCFVAAVVIALFTFTVPVWFVLETWDVREWARALWRALNA